MRGCRRGTRSSSTTTRTYRCATAPSAADSPHAPQPCCGCAARRSEAARVLQQVKGSSETKRFCKQLCAWLNEPNTTSDSQTCAAQEPPDARSSRLPPPPVPSIHPPRPDLSCPCAATRPAARTSASMMRASSPSPTSRTTASPALYASSLPVPARTLRACGPAALLRAAQCTPQQCASASRKPKLTLLARRRS